MRFELSLLAGLLLCCSPVQSQPNADTLMRQRVASFIASHAEDIGYDQQAECLSYSFMWQPLFEIGLSELAYDGSYPYLFTKLLHQAATYPKEVRRKGIKGYVQIDFTIDTTGLPTRLQVCFTQYADPDMVVRNPVCGELRREIERTVRQCIGQMGRWTPVRDVAGNKYPCRVNTMIQVGQQQLVHNVYTAILLEGDCVPPVGDDSGRTYPPRLLLHKIYDERHEPLLRELRHKELLDKETETTRQVYKAAGIL